MTSRSKQICYVRHQKHVEIAYVLETPDKPGDAQEELGREKEGKLYNIYLNPKSPVPEAFQVQKNA